MAVYVDVSECGRKNVRTVRSGTFMIVNLSSALIKENPGWSYETKLPLRGQSWLTLVSGRCAQEVEFDPRVG